MGFILAFHHSVDYLLSHSLSYHLLMLHLAEMGQQESLAVTDLCNIEQCADALTSQVLVGLCQVQLACVLCDLVNCCLNLVWFPSLSPAEHHSSGRCALLSSSPFLTPSLFLSLNCHLGLNLSLLPV